MMIDIVLDTETTGFDPAEGHRIIEIGCVELQNFLPTGRTFHTYLNPDRDVPPDATAVHGITTAFLADKPRLSDVLEDFQAFIQGARLVIHNADFDLKFLNAELKKLGFPALNHTVCDTVNVARQKFPGQPASLDALCRRFKIDLSARTLHGALLDAQLLAEVYLELMGGRQQGLDLASLDQKSISANPAQGDDPQAPARAIRPARSFDIADDESTAHQKLVDSLGPQALWRRYQS
jgi:DNA polymerase III subunit epsilon